MANEARAPRDEESRRETEPRSGAPAGRSPRHRESQPGASSPRPIRASGTRRTADAAHDGDVSGYLGAVVPTCAAPTWRRRLYIDRPADLRSLAADLTQSRVVALDAEFAQVRVRQPDEPSHRLALLQLATDNDYRASYVVDALRLADLAPLRDVMESPSVLKLFHGIGADARVLAVRGLVAHNTLDLEAVSRSIFGQRESGLQAMLQRACGIRLDKSLQRADWSRRPLTPAMVAYAARDAEMTLVLYGWLVANYPWAVALHETPAGELPAAVAAWILPYLEGARPRPAAVALAEVGLANDIPRQRDDLRAALAAVRHPNQRARVMRLITDLELPALAPNLRAYLAALASEERAGAARALGRLHDAGAEDLIHPLLEDPVQDVRQAAQLALANLTAAPVRRPPRVSRPPRSASPVRWSSDDADTPSADSGWRDALRARFAVPDEPEPGD